jgi:tetratricopeptide (TPR) repeat protein
VQSGFFSLLFVCEVKIPNEKKSIIFVLKYPDMAKKIVRKVYGKDPQTGERLLIREEIIPDSSKNQSFIALLSIVLAVAGVVVGLFFGVKSVSKDDLDRSFDHLYEQLGYFSDQDIDNLDQFDKETKDRLKRVAHLKQKGNEEIAYTIFKQVKKDTRADIIKTEKSEMDSFLQKSLDSEDDVENPEKSNEEIQLDKAMIAFRAGKYDEAIALFDDLLKLMPLDGNLCLLKGEALLAKKEPSKALDCFKKAKAISPEDAYIRYITGHCYFEIKQYDDAVLEFKKSIDLKPDQFEANYALGKVYMQQGKYGLAINAFDQAMKTNNMHADLWYHMALCYKELSNTDKALYYVKKALSIDPAFDDARILKEELQNNAQ